MQEETIKATKKHSTHEKSVDKKEEINKADKFK